MYKKCSKCKKEQDISRFYKDKTHKDGFRSTCISCHKHYVLENKEKLLKRAREHYWKYREHEIKRIRDYKLNNIEKMKEYRFNRRFELATYSKQYRIKNKEKLKKYRKLHRLEITEYQREKRRIDTSFRLANIIRSRIYRALKGNPKLSTSMKLVGYSIDFLKKYLQKQFKPGMSRSNYGYYGWHIDHIKPCCKFNLSKPKEQRKCFNYKNLRPLWAKENLSRRKKG